MTADDEQSAGFSLRRWSRRKQEAARDAPNARPVPPAAPVDARPVPPAVPPAPAPATATATADDGAAAPPAGALPPVETLTFDSDFTAFLRPKVDEALKRNALRTLFRDPRFNVMDGLDVYIDDYSIPDPISAEMVRGLVQSRHIFDPPQTRINAAGYVEDVPADERVIAAEQKGAEAPAAIAATDGSAAFVRALPASRAAVADAVASDGTALDATKPEAAAPEAAAPEAAAPEAAAPEAAAPIHPEPASRSDR